LIGKGLKANILHAELPFIHAIPHQISQLFANLISNSLKFSAAEPMIKIIYSSEISIDKNRTFHVFTYTDNGIGFDSAYQEKVFELFHRLHPKTAFEETGIGLSICKKIVENHQGEISALSEEGKGTTFIIKIPVDL
jgi:signal transduction histidine kinase